jgi:hypothetical protein
MDDRIATILVDLSPAELYTLLFIYDYVWDQGLVYAEDAPVLGALAERRILHRGRTWSNPKVYWLTAFGRVVAPAAYEYMKTLKALNAEPPRVGSDVPKSSGYTAEPELLRHPLLQGLL